MKKLFKSASCFLLIVVAFMLVGCDSKASGKDVSFEAQYIRTDGNVGEIMSSVVEKIQSVDELDTYYKDNMDNYNFSDNSVDSISFTTAIDKYDESYFEDSILLVILVEEDSSDIYHEIKSVNEEGKILISRKLSDSDDNDIVKWHIIVEVSKEYSDIDYSVSFDDVKE